MIKSNNRKFFKGQKKTKLNLHLNEFTQTNRTFKCTLMRRTELSQIFLLKTQGNKKSTKETSIDIEFTTSSTPAVN